METELSQYFKPETRKQGADLVDAGAVTLAQTSDTQIRSFIRKSPPVSVTFMSASIESAGFSAQCSCSAAAKGRPCKHMWATLLAVDSKYPDFLDSKRELSLETVTSTERTAPPPSQARLDSEAAFKEKQAAFKAKQADYRKQQYQSQKLRMKQRRQEENGGKRGEDATSSYPEGVKEALAYFTLNGFPLSYPADQDELIKAKRILSNVFHPDKGGAHDEMLELIRNFKLLTR